jgi:hypothetical protein
MQRDGSHGIGLKKKSSNPKQPQLTRHKSQVRHSENQAGVAHQVDQLKLIN